MTTKNTINTNVFADVLFIPIEAVHTTDTITWVISGKKRKQVIVGESNDNQIVVKQGLEEGEEVLLTTPANAEELSFYNLKGELTDLKPKKEASVESVNSNNK